MKAIIHKCPRHADHARQIRSDLENTISSVSEKIYTTRKTENFLVGYDALF